MPARDGTGSSDFSNNLIAKHIRNGFRYQAVEAVDSAFEIVVTLNISDTGANASGDYVGTNGTPMTLSGVADFAGYYATLKDIIVLDKDLQQQPLELWFFHTSPTVPNSNAAWNVSDADAANCVGVVPVTSWYPSTLNAIGMASPWLKMRTNASVDLYAAMVTRGTPTYSASGIQFRFLFAQD